MHLALKGVKRSLFKCSFRSQVIMTEIEVDEAIEFGLIECQWCTSFFDPNELSTLCNMLLSNVH